MTPLLKEITPLAGALLVLAASSWQDSFWLLLYHLGLSILAAFFLKMTDLN
jgi:hypothetical protein